MAVSLLSVNQNAFPEGKCPLRYVVPERGFTDAEPLLTGHAEFFSHNRRAHALDFARANNRQRLRRQTQHPGINYLFDAVGVKLVRHLRQLIAQRLEALFVKQATTAKTRPRHRTNTQLLQLIESTVEQQRLMHR